MKICWMVFTPFYCGLLFLASLLSYSALTYERPQGIYYFPDWSVGLGWAMAASTLIPIPVTAWYNTREYKKERTDSKCCSAMKDLLKPQDLLKHQLRPEDIEHTYKHVDVNLDQNIFLRDVKDAATVEMLQKDV